MDHCGSVIGDKSVITVRIVRNNLNGLRPWHFGNKKLESLKGALMYIEADIGAFK